MQDLNRYLRGWAGYFRYGNSARHFNLIEHHAHNRLALFVAKRHQRTRAYGWRIVTYASPNRLGLISLAGTVVAPRPHRAWKGCRMPAVKNVGEPCAGEPHARIDVAAGGNQASRLRRAAQAPLADPTKTRETRNGRGWILARPFVVNGCSCRRSDLECFTARGRRACRRCRRGSTIQSRSARPRRL